MSAILRRRTLQAMRRFYEPNGSTSTPPTPTSQVSRRCIGLSTSDGPRRRGHGRNALAVAVALFAAATVGVNLLAGSNAAAAAKKSKAQPVFTPKQVAGTYRWVKSTVSIRFSDGKTSNGEVPYGPNDTITFVVKAVPGTTAAGRFTMSSSAFGSSAGTWYLQDRGTVLVWITETDDADNAYSFRRIDQLDKKRMTLSADDALIVRTYKENGLIEVGGGRTVVGGSAYDELLRKS
jgi:hypothetical protein